MSAESSAAREGAARPGSNPRVAAVEALMALAAEMPWREITLPMIARRAELSLADLRDLFPSKGAMLGGFGRMIDRKVLSADTADMEDQPLRERVLDLMLRRLEAMAPYKAGLRTVAEALRADAGSMVALNQAALNSWRYLLASVGVDTEDSLSFVKLQGAAIVFARAFDTWLDDEDPELSRTMAVLDRELKRGEWVMEQAQGFQRASEGLRNLFSGLGRRERRDPRERAWSRDDWDGDTPRKNDGDDYAPAI